MAMNILFTAFKGKNNSSAILLDKITGDKLYLTNSYVGLAKEINHLEQIYDVVLMFGLDKNLDNEIRIEKIAENDGDIIVTNFDTEKIKRYFEKRNIKCTVSNTSTKYLCNAAYYHMLKKEFHNVVFMHIPTLKNFGKNLFAELLKFTEMLDKQNNSVIITLLHKERGYNLCDMKQKE